MLQRSPSKKPPTVSAPAARKARYRQRLRDCRIVPADFDVGEAEIDLLIRTGWLSERECNDRRQIGRALKAMLAEAAHK
jgi:hypothetical protein